MAKAIKISQLLITPILICIVLRSPWFSRQPTQHFPWSICWVGQKVCLFFPIRWLWQNLVVFNFIRNNFVRLYCDNCHTSMYFLKNLSKLVNFCIAILILKIEENTHLGGILKSVQKVSSHVI